MKTLFSFLLVFAVFGLTNLAYGQHPTAMKNATPQPPPGPTRPDSVQDSGLYGYWNNMSGQGRAGGALLGKVAIEGESLLWNPVLISVMCNGTTTYNTQSDPKGNFAIQVTLPATAMESDAKRHMETHFEGCEVRASFAGFHSNSITITQRNLRDDPDLGTITLSRSGGRSGGTAVSTTIESAPVAAVKAFEKARLELIDQKPDKAAHDLQKAVQAYPQFAEAWYQLGRIQQEENSGEARASFTKAAEADPQFVLPYEQLASVAAQEQKWQEVVEHSGHAMTLNPGGTAQTWYFDALGNFQLGKTDDAEAAAMKALSMDPNHMIPNTEQLLAVILAKKGDRGGAVMHLRNCLTYVPEGPSADLIHKQIALLQGKAATAK